MTERNIYSTRRATERARAVTKIKKEKARRSRIILTSIALSLAVVTAASFLVFGAINNNVRTADTTSAAVTKTIDTDLAAANASNNDTQTAQPAVQQTSVQNQSSQPTDAQQTDDNIKIINGERVYIDTKRPVPDVTGNPYVYYAYGKTSYGFDWTYSADNSNFVLRCDYNFDRQQYNFQFYGTAPGTANVTLYYNTDDNTQVPVNMTIVVDDSLNATLA